VAHPISEEDRDALTETLEEQTGKSVRLHLQEDPELVGGVVIRIGDHVFDGSVRNKLSNLHDRLRRSSLSLETDGSAA
jgi:F-type H+-transporting ATPase subunit delta